MATKKGTSSNGANLEDLKFAGHYRKAVKTSIARSASGTKIKTKPYPNLVTLLTDLNQVGPDGVMRKKLGSPRTIAAKQKPPKGPVGRQTRLPEELKNLGVTAWIAAVKYEGGATGDNDFHVILANATSAKNAQYMTAEVSGLPAGGPDVATLRAARRKLISLFPGVKLSSSFYKPKSPIKVRVEGSAFFDGDHYAGAAGPAGMKPQTSWEIHPVSSLDKA